MKILEIGPYPPPNTGWSVRIKYLKEAFKNKGIQCQVLNIGKNRKVINSDYIDVQNGFDYLIKLYKLSREGYHFHLHTNAQAVKGPFLILIASITSIFFQRRRAALTFHGGMEQLYFPRGKFKKECILIYLILLSAKVIICNDKSIKAGIVNYGPGLMSNKIYPIPAFSSQYMNFEKVPLPSKIEMFLKKKKYSIISYMALREGYYIETFIEYLKTINSGTGIVITGIGNVEDKSVGDYYQRLLKFEEQGSIIIVNDLDHDCFLTLLKRCNIYLRTYISDGVSSSVLEALALGTTVVACENGNRPDHVITYKADDACDLQKKVELVLSNRLQRVDAINEIKDTLEDEIGTLIKEFNSYS